MVITFTSPFGYPFSILFNHSFISLYSSWLFSSLAAWPPQGPSSSTSSRRNHGRLIPGSNSLLILGYSSLLILGCSSLLFSNQ